MPEVTDQPAKALRTWRPMAAWTAGILLVLGLIGLGVKIYVVYRETDRVVESAFSLSQTDLVVDIPASSGDDQRKTSEEEELMASLGTPSRAAVKLGWYLRVYRHKNARYVAAKRRTAVCLLRLCGPAAEGTLRGLSEDRDEDVRFCAAEALHKIRGEEAKP